MRSLATGLAAAAVMGGLMHAAWYGVRALKLKLFRDRLRRHVDSMIKSREKEKEPAAQKRTHGSSTYTL